MERLVFPEKFPVLGTLIFPVFPLCVETLKIFKNFLCVWALWYGMESLNFFKVPLCVGYVVWCGEFDFFKVPLCVGSVVWCVEFDFSQSSPVCGCRTVLWEDFELFRFPWVWVLVWAFPLWWRDCLLSKKIPVLGIFPLLWRD